MKDLFDEEIEIPQDKCFHCGATAEEGAILREANCSHGQGLLHCTECSSRCGDCGQMTCDWELVFVDCGETYGIVRMCEGCRKALNNESD